MDYIKLMKSHQPYAVIHKKMPQDIQDYAYHLCYVYNQTDTSDKKLRQYILQKLFRSKRYVMINSPFHCDYGFNIHFHGFAFMNYNDSIIDTSPVSIGSHVMVAPNVCISCSGHSVYPPQREEGIMVSKPIEIGNDVWIGANSFIMGGVTIGSGTTIGAGSTVTRDIPSNVVAFGSPCKVHRKVSPKDDIQDIANAPHRKTQAELEQLSSDLDTRIKKQSKILKSTQKDNDDLTKKLRNTSQQLKDYQKVLKTFKAYGDEGEFNALDKLIKDASKDN